MDIKELVKKVQEKKEFLELPESIIVRVLEMKKIANLDEESRIKEARAILRKYFGVFLTNKIVKGKLSGEEILKKHISSKDRDYPELYQRIIEKEDVIFDLGAGVNGFSVKYIGKKYVAIEAARVLVDLMNRYFKENKYNAGAIWGDLFDLNLVLKIINGENGVKSVWMFNIIDALELEPNFSKDFIRAVSQNVNKIVLSFPTHSLQKKVQFKSKRYWIINFIEDNFHVLDEFEMSGERFVVFEKK